MAFIVEFLRAFSLALLYCLPLIFFLTLVISLLGLLVGRREGWSRSHSLYYAFITATTVGYGDFHPKKSKSQLLAIFIALTGLVLTGIIVSLGVHATSRAFEKTQDLERIMMEWNQGREGNGANSTRHSQ
jgi:voltage-gated potassium channel